MKRYYMSIVEINHRAFFHFTGRGGLLNKGWATLPPALRAEFNDALVMFHEASDQVGGVEVSTMKYSKWVSLSTANLPLVLL